MACFGLFGGGKRARKDGGEAQKQQAQHLAKLKEMQRKMDNENRDRLETVAQFSDLFALDQDALAHPNSKAGTTASLISLEELDSEAIRNLEAWRRRINSTRNGQGTISLLAADGPLRQYVCDSLLRKHSITHLVDLFAQAAEDGALPEFCQDITPKDLVIGLFSGSLPDEVSHFVSLLCQGNAIVPLCWPVAARSRLKIDNGVSSTTGRIAELKATGAGGGGGGGSPSNAGAGGPLHPQNHNYPLFSSTVLNFDAFLYLQTAVKGGSSTKGGSSSSTSRSANSNGSSSAACPAPSSPKLLIWHGTAIGKTSLLQQAELTNSSLISQTTSHGGLLVPPDDLTKPSLVHRGSIDLSACSCLLPGTDVWIADVHSHNDARVLYDVGNFLGESENLGEDYRGGSKNGDLPGGGGGNPNPQQPLTPAEQRAIAEKKKQKLLEFRGTVQQANRGIVDDEFTRIVNTLLAFGLLCLHVDVNDFDPETGDILAPLVTNLLPRAAVLVWRDFDQNDAKMVQLMEKFTAKYAKQVTRKAGGADGGNSNKATLVLLENMSQFRSQARANAVVKQFRAELAQALAVRTRGGGGGNAWPDLPSHLELLAKFEENEKCFELLLKNEMLSTAEKVRMNFGLQQINERMRKAEEQERMLPWQNTTELEEHIHLAQDLAEKSGLLKQSREKYFAKGLDQLTLFFLEKLLLNFDEKKINAKVIGTSKSKSKSPADTLMSGGGGGAGVFKKALISKAQVDRIKIFSTKFQQSSGKTDTADDFMGMDSFWTELQQFYQCAVDLNFHARPAGQSSLLWKQLELSRKAYGDLITRRGAPMQLLAGNPLAISSQAFLGSVLRDLDCEEMVNTGGDQQNGKGNKNGRRKLRVISVIGAQSSAKSTLMNFLFGSDFAVSAGRCTCGLYASLFFDPAGKYAILVLDSEGLLGVSDSSRGDIFDGQMTLMALNCSHLVLINHKGELSRQLQDLIEICLFAMRHLKINKNRPKIGFVLRDQQDRSLEVHRQMLQTMKSHLHESAGKLGISLDDLIKIDDTAVYLLPSAYVTVRKHNVEVQWTPELFSAEILSLRSQIFAMFDSADMENVWENLEQWYAHTCHVWDTLVRFGHNLLHYKTIQEIEARKDLYELAKQTTQQIMEQDKDGFRAQCHTTTNHFIKRLQNESSSAFVGGSTSSAPKDAAGQHDGSSSALATDMIDLEFHRALTSLKEDFVSRSLVLFNQKANQDPRFHETMKNEARKKLHSPLDWVFENYLYTWKLSLKKKTDEHAMSKMWHHFTSVLNQYLADSAHQASLSEEKARSLFDKEWESYEGNFRARVAKIAKSNETIQYELVLQFNNVVSKLMHEGGPFALLQEQGPQYLWRGKTLLGESDAEWEKKYFHDGWRAKATRAMKGGGVAAGGSEKHEYNVKNLQLALETPNFLREQIIPKLKAIVRRVLYDNIVFADEIDPFAGPGTPMGGDQDISFDASPRENSQQMMDESMIIDWFRALMDLVVRVAEKEHLSPFLITLKRPQFIHELSILLRVAAYEKRLKEEALQNQKEMEVLLEHKQQIEDHFLLIIKANEDDVAVAQNFASMYHNNVKGYLQQEILNLCAEIRETVLSDMPDPAKAYERAYQQSFGARNYQEVLEYVLDVNAYVEKLFLIMFARRKAYVVDTKVASLRERVRTVYKLILSICDQWANAVKRLGNNPAGISAPGGGAEKKPIISSGGSRSDNDEAVPPQAAATSLVLDSHGEEKEEGGVDKTTTAGESKASDQDLLAATAVSKPEELAAQKTPTVASGGVVVGTNPAASSTSSTSGGNNINNGKEGAPPAALTMKDLKDFIRFTAVEQQPTAEELKREAADPNNAEFVNEGRNWKQDNLLKAYKVIVDRIPETADFGVRDAQIFCSAFRQHLLQLQENLEEKGDSGTRRGHLRDSGGAGGAVALEDLSLSVSGAGGGRDNVICTTAAPDGGTSQTNSWIDDELKNGLQEQSKTAWGMIKGCSARCPLCGSKCDQVGEHARHRCTHHLFPAFHGWMDRQNGFPSFHYCKSKEAFEGTYQCNDGEWRPLEVFLRETHEAWLPFAAEEDVSSVKDISLLQSAWVNCKVPLLEYFKPMVDEMPEEWEAFAEPDRALVIQDLRRAKDVIRKVRERRFVPEDHYKNLK